MNELNTVDLAKKIGEFLKITKRSVGQEIDSLKNQPGPTI
jgi:hypothetical protein